MTAPRTRIDDLVAEVPLGTGHEDQQRVVSAALYRLLVAGRRGVVLADEVGFGKTYEALAIVSHLCADARRRRRAFDRVLLLCKPALVQKWSEETSSTRPGRGFPRYLPPGHPAKRLFDQQRQVIDSRRKAHALRSGGLRGERLDGRNQAPPGLYVVNERLLQEEKRRESPLLSQLWRTQWDVIVVDEAHHYARGTKPTELFAPNRGLRDADQEHLEARYLLALTATPFELNPSELVDLLALVRAAPEDLSDVEAGLKKFVATLDGFFELRERSPDDSLRRQHVEHLERLRDRDALDEGRSDRGLQTLLRRYLLRNTKRQNERRYFLTERASASGFRAAEFRKLDDSLQQLVRRSPLVPFEREHALFYLELRALIQELSDARAEAEESRTFVPTQLVQGLSSYPQIAAADVIQRELPSAQRLRSLIGRWVREGKLHPKVAALRDIVQDILTHEIAKVDQSQDAWFSKILVFNKSVGATAPHLTKVLTALLEEQFAACLSSLLKPHGLTAEKLASQVRAAVDDALAREEQAMRADPAFSPWMRMPEDVTDPDLARFRGRTLLQAFRQPLRRRAVQTLALIDLARGGAFDEAAITSWVNTHVTGRVAASVRNIIDRYLDDTPHEEKDREDLVEDAERDLRAELDEAKSIGLVGRFDGSNYEEREAHRLNFNRRHNPFLLLVSPVGEEGIDLQEQCRYVIHYDLEWNPARMEQREGRVDRMGWGRAAEGFIDVRFLLLKGTYEERIFHTVMQRDQWFQVLIGSKKRQLGALPDDDSDDVEQDRIRGEDAGMLTPDEKARVMLDLTPEPGASLKTSLRNVG